MEYFHLEKVEGRPEDLVSFMTSKGYKLRVTTSGFSYDYIFIKKGFKKGSLKLGRAQKVVTKAKQMSRLTYVFH